jgi:hypothetical protein
VARNGFKIYILKINKYFFMKKLIIIILVFVLVGITGTVSALYLRIWNPMWNPFRPDPEVVISKMAIRMKEMDSFHVSGKAELEIENTGIDSEFDLGIDRTDPKKPRIKGSAKIPLFLTKIEFLFAEEAFYLNPGSYINTIESYLSMMIEKEVDFGDRKWIKIDRESLEYLTESEIYSDISEFYLLPTENISEEEKKELVDEIVKIIIEKDYYSVKEELPDEEIDGEMCYHYLISLNEEEIKNLVTDFYGLDFVSNYLIVNYQIEPGDLLEMNMEMQQEMDLFFEAVGDLDLEMWINQDGYCLHQVKFEKNTFGDEDLKSVIESILVKINFSDFQKDQDIVPPENVIEIKEIIEKIEEVAVGSRAKARDAKRESDIRQISLAMEMHYDENGHYPTIKDSDSDNVIDNSSSPTPNYMDPWPTDPGGGDSHCNSIEGQNYCGWINYYDLSKYCIWADLEEGGTFAASNKGTKLLEVAPNSLNCW